MDYAPSTNSKPLPANASPSSPPPRPTPKSPSNAFNNPESASRMLCFSFPFLPSPCTLYPCVFFLLRKTCSNDVSSAHFDDDLRITTYAQFRYFDGQGEW